MQLVTDRISIDELKKMSEKMFGGLVKAVVDIEREIMMVDAEMHADEEGELLEMDSEQKNLWGINIYPQHIPDGDWLEFDSIINIRPGMGNRSRDVEDPNIRLAVTKIVKRLVK
jgi:hypothetical protein